MVQPWCMLTITSLVFQGRLQPLHLQEQHFCPCLLPMLLCPLAFGFQVPTQHSFGGLRMLFLRGFITPKPLLMDLLEEIAGVPSQSAQHCCSVDVTNALQLGLENKGPSLLSRKSKRGSLRRRRLQRRKECCAGVQDGYTLSRSYEKLNPGTAVNEAPVDLPAFHYNTATSNLHLFRMRGQTAEGLSTTSPGSQSGRRNSPSQSTLHLRGTCSDVVFLFLLFSPEIEGLVCRKPLPGAPHGLPDS